MKRKLPGIASVGLAAILTACTQGSKSNSVTATSASAASPTGSGSWSPGPTQVPTAGSGSEAPQQNIEITDLKVGAGALAEDAKSVSILYRGAFPDGRTFDIRQDKKKPVMFKVGARSVITGLEAGVKGMRVGGKRRLVVPPTMAYGAHPFGEVIPPNSTLVFEVELVKVE